jgi:D-alanyl-D-alanine carboxypeptidase/D-alanyl-D-alanine-endopeptidase (penicillin-binding protein 4)
MKNLEHRPKPIIKNRILLLCAVFLFQLLFLLTPTASKAKKGISCRNQIKSTDSFLVATPEGKVLFEKNAAKQRIPASTLKVLTALAALDHFGPLHSFKTEFYGDRFGNLKIKGYGDPLLISEILHHIATILSRKAKSFQNIILDDTYFDSRIMVPGCDHTTNPYDAPVGALCANFNTVGFKRKKKRKDLFHREARPPWSLSWSSRFAPRALKAAGEPLPMIQRRGPSMWGNCCGICSKKETSKCGETSVLDRLPPKTPSFLLTDPYFHWKPLWKKCCIHPAISWPIRFFWHLAHRFTAPRAPWPRASGPPRPTSKENWGSPHIRIVEGSGLSRENRLSAYDMLAILEKFKPYKDLLKSRDHVRYKTGSLNGIRARAGYIESDLFGPCVLPSFLTAKGQTLRPWCAVSKRRLERSKIRTPPGQECIKVHSRRDVPSF